MIWLALAAAAAPPAVDRAVVAGEDIAAWRQLHAQALGSESQAVALRAFIVRFPESPLAEAAWAELVATAAPDAAWRAENRRLLEALDRARLAHAERAEEHVTHVAVVPLEPDGEAAGEQPTWTVHLHAGGALDGLGPAAAVGVRVGRGPWAGVLHAQVGARALGELTARLAPPVFGVGFLELGLDTRPRGVARLGVNTVLHGPFALDSSVGVAVGRDGVQPVVRLELAWTALGGASESSTAE